MRYCALRLLPVWLLFVFIGAGRSAELLQRESAEFPSVLVKLKPYEKNPIFVARGPGHWDEKIRERGWVLCEGNQWKMWYTGYQPNGQMKLGYATSRDGIAWERFGDGPIYEERWVEDMMVVPHDGTYYMFAEGYQDRAQLLTSSNGIHWVYKWPLDIRLTNDEPISPGPYGTPTAWFADGSWWLLYERSDDAVWLAKSTDLRTWHHLQDEPVLRPGPGKYDLKKIAVNQLLSYQGRYYVYYHGLGDTDGNWTTNIATSTDLRNWKKYEGNPLFPVETNKSSGFVVFDGDKARVYTMHSQVNLHFPRE